MPRIDVVYASHLQPGDLYAGEIVLDAPTRPVQPIARALRLARVEPVKDDAGRTVMHLGAARGLVMTPVPAARQVLVIREDTPPMGPCPGCEAPAGQPCEVWCIADQATPPADVLPADHAGPCPDCGCQPGQPHYTGNIW